MGKLGKMKQISKIPLIFFIAFGFVLAVDCDQSLVKTNIDSPSPSLKLSNLDVNSKSVGKIMIEKWSGEDA